MTEHVARRNIAIFTLPYMSYSKRRELADLYRTMRVEARNILMQDLAAEGMSEIRLADIGPEALRYAALWEDDAERLVDWSWEKLYKKWSSRPRHIALAIWIDPTLCCLVLGKITDGRVAARIDRIERNPNVSDDQIASVGVVAKRYLDYIGRIAKCRQAVVWEPASELIDYYKALGFTSEMVKRGKIVGLKYEIV